MRKKWMLRLENLLFTLNDLQIPVYASNACYFLAMSIFPALLLILASLRFTPLSATDLIRALEGILPSALMGAAESLIVSTYYNSSGTVVGISAAGGAAYVLAALQYAKDHGALTVGITSNAGSPISRFADIAIDPDTGAEVVTGSTRMKAGTAQKLILNMISTGVMIRLGHVYENMMINLRPTNIKLTARMVRIVQEITGLDEEAAKKLLEDNDWSIRKAVEMR